MGIKVTGIDQLTRVGGIADDDVNTTVIDIIGNEMPLWLGHAASITKLDNDKLQVTAFKQKFSPAITFCDPNIVSVGASPSELNTNDIAIGEIKMTPVGRALIMGKNRGLIRFMPTKNPASYSVHAWPASKAKTPVIYCAGVLRWA